MNANQDRLGPQPLSQAECTCLRRFASGSATPTAWPDALLESLERRGLLERVAVNWLPLETRRPAWRITRAGRAALKHCGC